MAFVFGRRYVTLFLPNQPPSPQLLLYQHIGVVEEQLRASKEEMERCLSEYDELFRTIQRLSEELNSQITANRVLQASDPTHVPYLSCVPLPWDDLLLVREGRRWSRMAADALTSYDVAIRGSRTGGGEAFFYPSDPTFLIKSASTSSVHRDACGGLSAPCLCCFFQDRG